MARIRTIKPEFFRHEKLQDMERETPGKHPMLVFAGLFTVADKSGRFEWKPRTLKLDILPFLDFDMSETLEILRKNDFITCYEVEGKLYGLIPSFLEHQRITGKEAFSPNRYPSIEQGNIRETTEKHPGAQEKEKEKEKEKESSEINFTGIKEKKVEIVFPFNSENFMFWWSNWKEYKKKEHRFSFKSILSEQSALKKLSELAGGREEIAIKVIEESISNGWEGLFPLKNGSANRNIPDSYKQKILDDVNNL